MGCNMFCQGNLIYRTGNPHRRTKNETIHRVRQHLAMGLQNGQMHSQKSDQRVML
jgi:hypothetical protein